MRRAGVLTAVALAAVLGAAPAARADETIYAGPPNRFVNPEVTIDQGEKLSFQNVDTVEHDVQAQDNGADGKPLFKSALVSRGGSAPVVGADALGPGESGFVCSIHPDMTGTLPVGGAGTSPPPPPPPASGDTRAPELGVRLLDSRLSVVRRRRALRVRVSTDEPVTVGVSARSGSTTLGSATLRLDRAGSKTVTLRLTKAGLRLVRKKRKLRVGLSASAADAAGNASTARASRTLR